MSWAALLPATGNRFNSVPLNTSPTLESCVCNSVMVEAVTSMTSVSAPTISCMSSVAALLTSTFKWGTSAVRKPFADTFTVYSPGVTTGNA